MKHQLQVVSAYLNALSLRERLMALIVIIAVIYAAFDLLVFSKLNQHYQQLQSQQQQLVQQQQEFTTTLEKNAEKLVENNRSIVEVKQAVNQAQQQLDETEVQLESVLNKLVPPTKITELLRSLLLETNELKLVSLNNEPVKKITIGDNIENDDDKSSSQALLYEHATIIKLSGSYQQVYQYLLALEQSDWGLFWDKLHYRVTEYPQAEITLRVHTISTDKYWIGL